MKKIMYVSSLLLILALAGCSEKVLDFRNAQISNGKIYADKANTPFSGKVTNVPANTLLGRQPGFNKFMQIGNTVLAQLEKERANLGISSASMSFSMDVCDAQVKEGLPDGKAICKAVRSEKVLLEIKLNRNILGGDVSLYSHLDPSKLFSKVSFKDGEPDGKQEIYTPDSNKLIRTVVWKNGVLNGPEEGFDEKTGKRVLVAAYSDGKFDGPLTKYAPDGEKVIARGTYTKGVPTGIHELFNPATGKLSARYEYVDGKYHGKIQEWDANGVFISEKFYNAGVLVPMPDTGTLKQVSNTASVDACVDSWTAAYRKERGDDAMIAHDQIGEWTDWCKQGRRP